MSGVRWANGREGVSEILDLHATHGRLHTRRGRRLPGCGGVLPWSPCGWAEAATTQHKGQLVMNLNC
jgi:hypothetical protein